MTPNRHSTSPHTPTLVPTRRFILFIWICAIGAVAIGIGMTAPGASRAQQEFSASRVMLLNATRDAEDIHLLRNRLPADDLARGGLTPRIAGVLERAGLSASVLASVSPEAESHLAGHPGLRVSRRRATLTLSGVTLPHVGKFLDAWRSCEPCWTPASIDISPAGGKAPEAGGDLPLRTVITIECIAVRRDGDRL